MAPFHRRRISSTPASLGKSRVERWLGAEWKFRQIPETCQGESLRLTSFAGQGSKLMSLAAESVMSHLGLKHRFTHSS